MRTPVTVDTSSALAAIEATTEVAHRVVAARNALLAVCQGRMAMADVVPAMVVLLDHAAEWSKVALAHSTATAETLFDKAAEGLHGTEDVRHGH